jgi:hypothetical protein
MGHVHKDSVGNIVYIVDNYLHREDGPAHILNTGDKFWYLYGERHRTDGPAIEWADGGKSWYYRGERIYCNSQEEFLALITFW